MIAPGDDAPADSGAGPASAPVVFATEQPAFIDFGCGAGGSMPMAEAISRGTGFGLEIDPARVATAQAAGYDVHQGDILSFAGRAVAQASFAVDLLPELPTRRDFEAACATMLLAARDFAIIQHLCFDTAEALLARGLVVAGHADKSIRLRPRAVDYVHFVQAYAARLDIVGLAVFGVGEPRTEPSPLAGLRGLLLDVPPGSTPYRSLRVIIGRKATSRFQIAMKRAGTGDLLLHWEAAG